MRKPTFFVSSLFIRMPTAFMALFLGVQPLFAQDLKDILNASLANDPIVLEAGANVAAAQSTTKATRARHYPVLSLVGTQVLAQKHRYDSNDMDNGFGARGRLNLYSWGGINAAVQRDKQKEAYYQYQYLETREQLGNEIGKLYISALRAKEALAVSRQSLARHEGLLQDLNVIAKYDRGRRSELIEARARQLQVETAAAQWQRTLELSLSSLAKYTGRILAPDDLQDPFRNDSAASLMQRFNRADGAQTSAYLAQQAERESVNAELAAAKAERLPAVNLEGNSSRDAKELYVTMSWNILDMPARHNIKKYAQALAAADYKADQVLRETAEKARTAEIDMVQNERRADIGAQHIEAQKDVVRVYELQFKIARRTLTDVLGAYNELSSIEQGYVTARNDFRDAALDYLAARERIADWAGVKQQ